MSATGSELRIPADPAYILVAKRAAAGFASVAGLDVGGVDDVVIAVTQACQNAIACCDRAWGPGQAQLRLLFELEDHGLEVQVQSLPTPAAAARRRTAAGAAELASRMVAAAEAQHRAAHRLALEQHRQLASRAARAREAAQLEEATDLALRVMGLFVDDYGYRVDQRTGGLRVRLTKYRAL